MVRFLKIKFLIMLKLNFNGGQFNKKILNSDYLKNCKFCRCIKLKIKNGEHLRKKFWDENFE